MPSLSTQGLYFLPICSSLVFATKRQIPWNNRRHHHIKHNVFWVPKILKHERLGSSTSNGMSWARTCPEPGNPSGRHCEISYSECSSHTPPCSTSCAMTSKKNQRHKQELLQLCDPFSVCKHSICDALEESWLGLRKGAFPNFYTSCVLKTAEGTNSNYHQSSKGTLCCLCFYHDWLLQQKRWSRNSNISEWGHQSDQTEEPCIGVTKTWWPVARNMTSQDPRIASYVMG